MLKNCKKISGGKGRALNQARPFSVWVLCSCTGHTDTKQVLLAPGVCAQQQRTHRNPAGLIRTTKAGEKEEKSGKGRALGWAIRIRLMG